MCCRAGCDTGRGKKGEKGGVGRIPVVGKTWGKTSQGRKRIGKIPENPSIVAGKKDGAGKLKMFMRKGGRV